MAHTLEDFLKLVPMKDLATKLDASEADVQQATELALPALLGGMAVNSNTDEGAAKLVAATKQHERRAASLADIDESDGKKIVKKVLGAKEAPVTQALEGQAANTQIAALIPKLLPLLAPLLMQFLSGSMSNETKQQPSAGGVGDLLGGLLGGSSQAQGGLGNILGSVLGGSNSNTGGGGLGGLLGGLFK